MEGRSFTPCAFTVKPGSVYSFVLVVVVVVVVVVVFVVVAAAGVVAVAIVVVVVVVVIKLRDFFKCARCSFGRQCVRRRF